MNVKDALTKYNMHVWACVNKFDKNGNKVDMKMTFEEWCQVWLDSGKWELRGRGKYMMCRKGDLGHYEVGNVEIKSALENNREARNGVKHKESSKKAIGKANAWSQGRPCMLISTGEKFPNLKALARSQGWSCVTKRKQSLIEYIDEKPPRPE